MSPRLIDVKRLHERLTEWSRATAAKLKQREWRLWLLIVFLVYVGMEAFRSVVSDASTLLVVWIFKGVLWLVRQPMGFGGVALFTSLMVLLGLSWWQTRPKSKANATAAPELSEPDRRIVQDLRTIWNRHGQVPVSQMRDLLKDALYDLKRTAYWAALADPVVTQLDRAIEQMSLAISFGSSMSVTQVRERFNEMYSAYVDAMRWFARLEAHGDITLEGERLQRLEWWRENHYHFYEKLQDLIQTPEHHQTLKIFPRLYDDEVFARFLRAAEARRLPSRDDPEDRGKAES